MNKLIFFLQQQVKKNFFSTKEIKKCIKISFNKKRNLTHTQELNFFLKNYKKNYTLISSNVVLCENIDSYLEVITNSIIITDKKSISFFSKNYLVDTKKNELILTEKINNGKKLREIILKINKKQTYKKIICIGGGRPADLSKFIAMKANKKLVCIPTSLATHGYASSKIHALPQINQLGYSLTINGNAASLSIIDMKIIKKLYKKNKRLIYSGFGDLIAFYNSFDDWFDSLRNKKNHLFKIHCVEKIKYILESIDINRDINHWIHKYIFIQVLLCNLTDWAGSAPASGSEHFFANLYEKKYKSKAFHGELVSWGVLIFQFLRNKNYRKIINLMNKYKISRSMKKLQISKKKITLILKLCRAEGLKKKRKNILDNFKYINFDWETFVKKLFLKRLFIE